MSTVHIDIEGGYLIEQRNEWDEAKEEYIYIEEKVKKTIVHGNWGAPWNVEIKGNKIICFCEKEYSHGIEKQRKVFDLQDGTLVLSGGQVGERYVGLRTRKFTNWLQANNLTQVNTRFFDEWADNEDSDLDDGVIIMYGHNANCGAGTAAHIIVTDGKLISQEIESAGWVEEYDGCDCDDSRSRYVIDNPTYIIEFSVMDYRDNHNHARTLYIHRGDDVFKYDLTLLPEEIKELLRNFSGRKASHIFAEVKAPKIDGMTTSKEIKEEPKKSSDGEATHLFG